MKHIDVIFQPSLHMQFKKLGKTMATCTNGYQKNKLQIAFIVVVFSIGLRVDQFHLLLKTMGLIPLMGSGVLQPQDIAIKAQTPNGFTLVPEDPRVVTTRYGLHHSKPLKILIFHGFGTATVITISLILVV